MMSNLKLTAIFEATEEFWDRFDGSSCGPREPVPSTTPVQGGCRAIRPTHRETPSGLVRRCPRLGCSVVEQQDYLQWLEGFRRANGYRSTDEAFILAEYWCDVAGDAPGSDPFFKTNFVLDFSISGTETLTIDWGATATGSMGNDVSIELRLLLDAAKNHVMTPEEYEQQRRSFAYGNLAIEDPTVTRERIDEADELMKKGG
jgi:hypothetical protein